MYYSREELALDALIAASLRAVEFQKKIPQSEIDSCLNDEPVLSDSNRRLLDRFGNDVFHAASKFEIHKDIPAPFEESSQYVDAMAMNRKNAKDEISEETRKEIEKKREELKKKLAEKRKKKNNGTAD